MGFTQGEPMSPIIVKMVVDAVINHWLTAVAREDAGTEVFGREVQKLTTLFYMDNVLLASTRAENLQEVLGVLTGLFGRFGLWTNVEKKDVMV